MANQSVLELAVNTGKWDAGLKKATQALNNFTEAGGGLAKTLQDESGKMQQFVSMMGGLESKAKTAKGQMNDYKSAIEQLTMQYNRMSQAQQQSIGQSYLQAIDQLKQKYQGVNAEIEEMNRALKNTPQIQLPAGGGGFLSGLGDKMGGMLQVFGGNLMTQAAGAVMNLGSEISNMIQQGVELARQGEGIRIAFERLGRGDILDGLRQATHGTVTDIELMKAAVKFNDFKLPVEELGTMLAFAQQKAKDTGQSINYMTESLVTGLGRKSVMILDNLGLSAAEIKEKMAETGDMTKAVGAIIREQMAKAGDYTETAADRAAQAEVQLKNAMEELGRTFAPLQEAGASMFKSWEIGALNFITTALDPLIARFTEAGRLQAAYNRQGGSEKVNRMTNILQNTSADKRQGLYNTQVNSFNRFINERQEYINLLNSYRAGSRGEGNGYTAENKARIDQFYKRFGTDDTSRLQSQIDGARKQLQEYQKAAKDILKPVEANIDTKQAEQNVKTLTAQLKELEKQRKDAVKKGDQELVESLTKQISQTKTNIGYLDPNALKTSPTTTPRTTKVELTEEEKKQKDAERELETATKRLAEAQRKRAEQINKLNEEGVDAVRNNNLGQAIKVRSQAIAAGYEGDTSIPVTFTYSQDNMSAIISMLKSDLSASEIGSDMFNALTEQLNDATALSNLISYALKNGIEASDLSEVSNALFQQLLGEGDIPDEALESFKNAIGETLGTALELGGDGSLKEGKKDDNKAWEGFQKSIGNLSTAMSGLTTVTSGLQALGIKIDGDFANLLTGLQGAISIVQGVISIINALSVPSEAANTIATHANTAALAAMTAALHSNTFSRWLKPFAAGGIVPHAADGFLIPGNDYSDRTPILAQSGELILNRAQQGNLVAQMQGGGMMNMHIEGIIAGEDIRLVLKNGALRRNESEYLNFTFS